MCLGAYFTFSGSPPAAELTVLFNKPFRRLRNKKWGSAADSPPAGAEEAEKEDVEEVEHRESQKEESRSTVGGGEQMETDDCEVPGTEAPPLFLWKQKDDKN